MHDHAVALDGGNRVAPAVAELRRQTQSLIDSGLPALAGCTADRLRRLAGALEPLLPQDAAADSVILVPGRQLAPAHRLVELARLAGRPGFTSMPGEDLARFVPTPEVAVPEQEMWLIVDVDTGAGTLGVRPNDALPEILASGRTPLTLEEGVAVALAHPEWLRERNCFQMLGSRAGDKRVTGMWVSKGAPRLGWCWGGNPHSWLGMATAGGRLG